VFINILNSNVSSNHLRSKIFDLQFLVIRKSETVNSQGH